MDQNHTSANKKNQFKFGLGCEISASADIHPGVTIEENVEIKSHVSIENGVHIAAQTSISSGSRIGFGTQIGQDVQIGANVCFISNENEKGQVTTVVANHVQIGANSTILAGIRIGNNATIEPGSVVKQSIPANAIVSGNPAVIVGYNGIRSLSDELNVTGQKTTKVLPLDIGSCILYELPWVSDMRGDLSVAEYGQTLPFVAKRCFWVFNVPNEEVRGEHAHKTLHQYLICVHGSISVVLDDAQKRQEVRLDKPNLGLYIPPLTWGIQYKHTHDAVLMVLASDVYDSQDYIRDYEEFVSYVDNRKNK